MTALQLQRIEELRGLPHLAPADETLGRKRLEERQRELAELSDALLNEGRGRGRKPAHVNWLTERQLETRRSGEVLLGDAMDELSCQRQFRFKKDRHKKPSSRDY